MLSNLLYKYFHSIHKPKSSPTTLRKLCERKSSTQLLNILEDDAFAITHQPYSWYMLGLDDNEFQGYFVVKIIAAHYLYLSTVSPQGCVAAVTSVLSTAELHPATTIALVSLGALLVSHRSN